MSGGAPAPSPWGSAPSRESSPPGWYLVVAILVGGVLVAVLRRFSEEADLDEEVALAADPVRLHRRRTAFLAVSAIVAVAFGAAVGPEAGLIAVVAEVSSLAALRMARSREEQRLIGRVGSVAGLAAATTVGLRKPVAALLIGLFVVHGAALGPLVVGVAVGFLVLTLLPEPSPVSSARRSRPER